MIRSGRIEYKHFGTCLLAGNGVSEVVVACDFGIRVLSYALCGGENVFFEQPAEMRALTTEQGWRIYGGHRLWVSPESERDYYPDNLPVAVDVEENAVILRQPKDPWLGVSKEVRLRFFPDARIEVTHSVTNCSGREQRIALWAISSMRAGGTEKIPLPGAPGPWEPRFGLTAWEYTDLSDARAAYGKSCVEISQRAGKANYKIGLSRTAGEYEYRNKGLVFQKTAEYFPGAQYPDGGVCFETFVCDHMLEMETLSPLFRIAENETAVHREVWNIWEED